MRRASGEGRGKSSSPSGVLSSADSASSAIASGGRCRVLRFGEEEEGGRGKEKARTLGYNGGGPKLPADAMISDCRLEPVHSHCVSRDADPQHEKSYKSHNAHIARKMLARAFFAESQHQVVGAPLGPDHADDTPILQNRGHRSMAGDDECRITRRIV